MARDSGRESGPRRPLLAGGELLSIKFSRPGKPQKDKYHPLTIDEAHALLAPQAALLRKDVEGLPDALRGRHVVFEATLHPNYLASSYFPTDVVEGMDLYVVGTRAGRAPLKTAAREKPLEPTKTLMLAGEPDRVLRFARLVESSPNSEKEKWEVLREFKSVAVAKADAIVGASARDTVEPITWESVLSEIGRTPEEQEEWSVEGFRKWAEWVSRIGGRVADDYLRRVGGLSFVPVLLDAQAIREAARFNLLRAIRPMPQIRPFPECVVRMVGRTKAPQEKPRRSDLTVAIFDGGVDGTSKYFSPFVSTKDLTGEPANPEDVAHGTLVTSALLYGHLPPGAPLPQPVAPVVHYRVLPPPPTKQGVDTSLYWILDRITEAVRADDLRIVNLSLGPNECVEDDRAPTRWTAELDRLAHEKCVSFISAVGNNGDEDAELGFNRVMAPADMVNGMGVGACAASDPRAKLERAPYSAVGPGREGQRVQPTVVAFGGDEESDQFVGIDGAGRLRSASGTSFAAPLVARAVADVLGSLEPDKRRPEVARAFCVHFSSRLPRGHRATELGHGRCPDLFDHIWDCPENTCTLVYDQELARGRGVALRFPLPLGLPASTLVEIEWTLSFSTEVDTTDAVDYTACGLEVQFRPHELLREVRDPTAPKGAKPIVMHVERDEKRIEEAYRSRWHVPELPPAGPEWKRYRNEKQLRLAGKWETMIRGRIKMPAGKLFSPRLDLVYLRRAKGTLLSGSDVPPLRVWGLATIRLPDGTPLYDLVRAQPQFQALTPLISIPIQVAAL